MTDIVIRADQVVYWGDTGRLLQQVAQLLGVSPDNVTVEIVGSESNKQPVPVAVCPKLEVGDDVYYLDPFSWELAPDGMPE